MDLAIGIAGGIAAIVLLGAISAGSALGLHLLRPAWTRNKRIFSSAAVAALLPMSIAFAGFFLAGDVDEPTEFALALLALTVFTVVLGILCLPAAWITTRRVEKAESDVPLLEGEDSRPVLIGGDS